MSWNPTAFKKFIECYDTSTGVARILTDAGEGFVKALGNDQGPQALAKEFIGTSLAKVYGLKTFEFAIMNIRPDDEIQLGRDKTALPGPAFITKKVKGVPWSGTADELKKVSNTEDFSKLIVFDTFLLNPDRYPPNLKTRNPNYDNVFLSSTTPKAKKFDLIAMDFTHCLDCGAELTNKIKNIEFTKEERVYGFFPEFREFVDTNSLQTACQKLAGITQESITEILNNLPHEWAVNGEIRGTVSEFLINRVTFLCDNSDYFSVYLNAGQIKLQL